MPPDTESPNTIPSWAATIIANVAEIKTRTERLPVIERELDEMRGRQVPMSEHLAVQARSNALWDAWQRYEGAKGRDRFWMGGLTLATLLIGAVQSLHLLGLIH